MSQAQREATADAVNAAIMVQAGGGWSPTGKPPLGMQQVYKTMQGRRVG